MSAQQFLHRSSTDSSLTLHDLDDDDNVFHPSSRISEKSQSSLAMFQHLHCMPTLGRMSLRWTALLLPSFLRDWKKPESSWPPSSGGKQALTALNGLRGVACLIVFNYHLLFVWTHNVDASWGTIINMEGLGEVESSKWQDKDQKSLFQLPFVRLLYAGPAMVIVFFVISGYVLSHKPVKQIRSGKFAELQHTLSSSVFRRGIRLFGPTIVGTFITMLFTHAGYFEATKGVRTDSVTFKGCNEEHPVLFSTFHEQVWDWVCSMGVLISNAWDWNLYFNNYDPHLWTIPLEFRSSMVLFLSLLALSRLRPIPRLTVMFVFMSLCLAYWAHWEVFLFLAGAMFAELDIISGMFTESSLLENDMSQKPRSLSYAWIAVMLAGLFFSSCPTVQPENAPGYMYLATFIPEPYSWQRGRPFLAIGGCLIVWSFMHLPSVQRIFTMAVPQYLGQISYAFYIVHGPILHGFGYNFLLYCWSWTGRETALGFGSGLVLAVIVILPLAIWAADLFWRAVDTSFVELGKWTEKKLLAETSGR